MCLVFLTNRAITIYFIFKTMNNKIHLISATWKWNGNEACVECWWKLVLILNLPSAFIFKLWVSDLCTNMIKDFYLLWMLLVCCGLNLGNTAFVNTPETAPLSSCFYPCLSSGSFEVFKDFLLKVMYLSASLQPRIVGLYKYYIDALKPTTMRRYSEISWHTSITS